jgi:ABC-2 type transport system ATP-binding protein
MSASASASAPAIVVDHVSKTFARTRAVKDVSFEVEAGEIFALLGPNGAGKTTIIRMVLDILKPDSGTISILGGPMCAATRDRVGYLPEDRGLYRNLKLMDCLTFLAGLKGMPQKEARQRAQDYLERFDLIEHRKKKIKDLSRGMQQKAQFIATLLHDPQVLIVDEPFAGFDPVNVLIIKEMLQHQAAAGKTIILSAHEMHLVQELASRMVMISGGEVVLYGRMREVRRRFATNAVIVEGQGEIGPLPGISSVQRHRDGFVLHLADGTSPQTIMQMLGNRDDFLVERFEIAMPTLDEIFVRVAQNHPPGVGPEAGYQPEPDHESPALHRPV